MLLIDFNWYMIIFLPCLPWFQSINTCSSLNTKTHKTLQNSDTQNTSEFKHTNTSEFKHTSSTFFTIEHYPISKTLSTTTLPLILSTLLLFSFTVWNILEFLLNSQVLAEEFGFLILLTSGCFIYFCCSVVLKLATGMSL